MRNKNILITGASKGIGKEVALLFANLGANVGLIARNIEELKTLQTEIDKTGGTAYIWSFDLTHVDKIDNVVDSIVSEMGSIDVLINNAGINIAKPAEELTVEDWDKVMDINLKSTFFLSQAVGKHMKVKKKGKIINVSSQMAFVGYFKRSAYSTSKGGMTQMTKALAIEWAENNINVNAIAPTFIQTPMTEKMFENKAFKDDVMSRIPLGRLAKTEDLYGAFIYLASDTSNMVTGHTLVVDGGWTVW